MEKRRKMPIGIQSFEKIIEDGYVYVDKTHHIYNMVESGCYYFLSRPRRFGKSLLVSTMHEYFSGNKYLFEGLYLGEHETEWNCHPVFHFDFSGQEYCKKNSLELLLNYALCGYEELYEVTTLAPTLSLRFARLLKSAYEKTGQQCVVLVDEYDKPLLETFDNEELNTQYRNEFKSFFGVLKGADRYVKFAFITGITKLRNVSIFSDLNNLNDISLSERYSDVCGITQEELETYFRPEIRRMAARWNYTEEDCISKLKKMYDGYHFAMDLKDVYNPYSLINALDQSNPSSYWFGQATPTFLINRLRRNSCDIVDYAEGLDVDAGLLGEIEMDPDNPTPLLYQSGYLTIKSFDPMFKTFRLTYPNEEIRVGFTQWLVPLYSQISTTTMTNKSQEITRALISCDLDCLFSQLKSIYSFLPYKEGGGDKGKMLEQSFRNVASIVFAMVGAYVVCEPHFSRGRADLVVQTSDYIYVFEFKIDQTAQTALEQIETKGYADPYKTDPRKVVKVGVNFSTEERNISEWKAI